MKKITTLFVMLFCALSGLMAVTMTGGEKLYLTPNSNWTQANARFAAYFFGTSNAWASMTAVAGETNLYEVTVPSGSWSNVIFCRMNPSAAANNWDNKWNQSGDLVYDGTNNWYKVPSGQWDGFTTGWTIYTPPTPDPEPEPEPSTEVVIKAIRNRLSINTNDFTDFAGLYVSKLPTVEGGTLSSYAWEYSTNNTTWSAYSAGDGASWDNIRPNKAGYYRCVLTYEVGGNTQTVNSNTLQITNSGGSTVTFSSNLPVVLVRTSKDFPTPPSGYPTTEQVAELKAKRSVDVKILWNKNGGNVSNSDINNKDMLHYDRKARMNYRGSSSLNNPKKSFAFVTGDKNCDSKKLGEVKTKKFAMFDGDSHKDWVMYASYPDATFMRNILSYHQYAKMTGLWGVKCRYVEMYLDGEYQGIYVFMDKMTQDETRINVNEDTGYIVRFDKTDIVDRYDGYSGANEDYKRCTFITSNTGKKTISTYNMQVDQAFEIEYPEREDIATFDDDGNVTDDSAWEAKVNEVKGMFVNMENAILANDYDKLAQIIDYQTWADWFIFNEFSKNADAYRISCVFQINSASEKIVANPIWDYELGLGNQDTKTSGLLLDDLPDNTKDYYDDDFPTPFWWIGKGKPGCNGILGDCKFRAMVKERWALHTGANGALNSTVLNAKIDSLANVLSQGAGTREKNKWNTYSSSSTSTLKSWITNRTSGLNSIINGWTVCDEDDDQDTPKASYYIAGALIENGIAVSGGEWCCGLIWDPAGCALTNNTVTYTGLAAGEYKFKVTDGTWSKNWGYSALSSTSGLTNDSDVNVVVTLSKASDVTITFNPITEKISVIIKESSVPEPEVDFTIAAIRNRLSINTNDFTDFAGLYVAELPTVEGGELDSYQWQYSTDKNTWAKYSDGQGASWDNIRPNKAGYYRCVITYNVGDETVEQISNVLQITSNGGSTVSFSSKLPVFLVRTSKDFPNVTYLDNDGVAEMKAKRSVDVKILWNQEGGSVTNSDVNNSSVLHYDRKARMNYRGSSSLRKSKKSYAFVTGDKNCDAKKLGEVKTKKFGMFGAEAHKDWVLYASAPDATYMRNVLSFHQYAQMTGLWGVKCRHVELYVDGDYKGIYVFMDKITADENRVNIGEDGYIVKFDKTDEVDSYDAYVGANEDYKRCTFITSNTGKRHISTYEQFVDQAFEIDYPEREDIAEFDDNGNLVDDYAWDAKVTAVKAKFTAMESAILTNNYDKLATLIDYETWADWFIINEFTKNADAYRISCVFTLNSIDDKIVANPIWDYELGWGNENEITTGLMVKESRYYSDSFPTPFWWTGEGKSGCNGILGDCKFRAIVKERWAKYIAAEGALNSTVLTNKIDSIADVIATGSEATSVSTSSLKSWVTDRTAGLNTVISAWETCPVPSVSNLKIGEFASVYVGETSSATATYTVANAKSVVASLSGSDAFSIVSESNGSVVLTFAPTAAGTFNGTLTITADGIVSENINFSASAILKPEISDLVAPIFGEIYVGETTTGTATYSVENANSVEVELTGDNAFAIASKSNGVVEITFTPAAAGTFNGILTITADGVVSETISFSASAILKPVISDLVAPVFTQIYVGETATGTATFSVANASDVEIELAGDAFSLVSKTDGSAEIEFVPSAAGTFNGTLTITADEVVTETIEFSAVAILKPVISDLVAPAFDEIYVGETTKGTATFSVANANNVEVELSGDAVFSILSESNGAVEITFAPESAGTFNGTITITADGVVTENINFSASAILKPAITDLVAPAFDEIYVGETTTGTATFSVANANNVEVELSGDAVFSILNESNGAVEITFAPESAGTFNGTLTITADEVVTETINFSASAILKPVITDLVAPVFAQIYVGETTTGTATYSVANANNIEVELSGDAVFSILNESNGAVEITFAPESAGTFNGTLTITADEVVTETINFSASAILKPVITDLVAPVFAQIYVGETTTGTATYSVANANNVEVELSGDAVFSILSESNGAVEITFAPESAGTFNGTLTITADGVATENINFSASAILKPAITDLVAPTFEEIYVGETTTGTATFSVANANNVEVELSGDAAFSILSESNGAVEITFAPESAGTFNGTLTITADEVVTETIEFSAVAILKPVISDLVAPVFTQIYVGESATGTATFFVANASDVEIELAGDAFSLVSKTDGSAEIEFVPSAAGTFNGTITITADGVATENINFSASAILKPAITDLVAPAFDEIYVGETTTGTATFSIANANNVEVELSGDAAFSILSESNGAVEITFAPESAGTFNGTLTITADGVATENINFSASAILKPAITDLVAPTFDEIYVGETTKGTATFSVANANKLEVELSGEGFSIISETDGSVEILFAPTAAGTFNGSLTITADGVVTEIIEFTAVAIEGITTDIEENAELNIYAKDGTIYCDEEFTIYTLSGLDVTSLNGSLQGVYVVTTAKGNKQVSVW